MALDGGERKIPAQHASALDPCVRDIDQMAVAAGGPLVLVRGALAPDILDGVSTLCVLGHLGSG